MDGLNKLCLSSHEFYLLCDDLESGALDTCLYNNHRANENFAINLIKSVKVYVDIMDDKIYFLFSLGNVQIDLLKRYIEWSYNESFSCIIHSYDRKCFLSLREKILCLNS
jgi:hypothetical protein